LQQVTSPAAESVADFRTNAFVWGWGGWMGAHLYYGALRDNLGNLGAFVILLLLYVVAMTISFVESPARVFDGLHHSFLVWRERRRELRTQRRAERLALKEARQEEKRLAREKAEEQRAAALVEPPPPVVDAPARRKIGLPKKVETVVEDG